VDSTREGEVDGSITNNHVARKMPRLATGGWGGPNKNNFFLLFLKSVLCFLEKIYTGGFITSTASENRFSLAVLLRRPPLKIAFHWRSSVTRL
jgi:hypothetical protein